MTTGYVIPVDPAELANRFSTPNLEDEILLDEEEAMTGKRPPRRTRNSEGRIAPLLNRIPKREADLIYLYFIQEERQADIAIIFNVTQAAISYHLDRGLSGSSSFLSIPQITEEASGATSPRSSRTSTSHPRGHVVDHMPARSPRTLGSHKAAFGTASSRPSACSRSFRPGREVPPVPQGVFRYQWKKIQHSSRGAPPAMG